MFEYKYKVIKEKGIWHFVLLPGNNNLQYVAISNGFDTKAEVLNAIRDFQNQMSRDNSYSVTQIGKEKYTFIFKKSGITVTNNRGYSKNEVNNGAKRVIEHYNCQIK